MRACVLPLPRQPQILLSHLALSAAALRPQTRRWRVPLPQHVHYNVQRKSNWV